MSPSTPPPKKRSILITGCSDNSLGLHLALAFAATGQWRVFASVRNLSKATQATSSGTLEIIQLDTLSPSSISSAATQISSLTDGSLDLLLNNAGAGYSMPLLDLEWEKCRDLFELNFWSPIAVTKAFLPLLRKSVEIRGEGRGGIVVNNTSCSSLWVGALPFAGAYNASKGAATQMTETLRLELAPFGIRVVNLMTGGVKSGFYDNAPKVELPEKSLFAIARERVERTMSGVDTMEGNAEPEGYAREVARKLSKDKPSYWVWAGKFTTLVWLAMFLPVGLMDSVAKKMSGLDVVERELKKRGVEGKGSE